MYLCGNVGLIYMSLSSRRRPVRVTKHVNNVTDGTITGLSRPGFNSREQITEMPNIKLPCRRINDNESPRSRANAEEFINKMYRCDIVTIILTCGYGSGDPHFYMSMCEIPSEYAGTYPQSRERGHGQRSGTAGDGTSHGEYLDLLGWLRSWISGRLCSKTETQLWPAAIAELTSSNGGQISGGGAGTTYPERTTTRNTACGIREPGEFVGHEMGELTGNKCFACSVQPCMHGGALSFAFVFISQAVCALARGARYRRMFLSMHLLGRNNLYEQLSSHDTTSLSINITITTAFCSCEYCIPKIKFCVFAFYIISVLVTVYLLPKCSIGMGTYRGIKKGGRTFSDRQNWCLTGAPFSITGRTGVLVARNGALIDRREDMGNTDEQSLIRRTKAAECPGRQQIEGHCLLYFSVSPGSAQGVWAALMASDAIFYTTKPP